MPAAAEKTDRRYFPVHVREIEFDIMKEISKAEDLPMKYVFGFIMRDWLQSHPDRRINVLSHN
jgi:hypothetical protein